MREPPGGHAHGPPAQGRARITRLRATTSAGTARVVGTRKVVIDLRRVARTTARVTVVARTAGGRTFRQTRQFRTCVTQRSLRDAVGG